MKYTFVVLALLLLVGCSTRVREWQSPERQQTEKLLGVQVHTLPGTESQDEFDEADPNAPTFKGTFKSGTVEPVDFDPSLGERSSVYATAPDGTIWEAFCGRPGQQMTMEPGFEFMTAGSTKPDFVETFEGFKSDPGNTRQDYDTHHGYSFNPADVFIGKRMSGRLVPSLFFRDVGSHTTAPHHLAIDASGNAHLVVADVNISAGNNLDLYWVTGSPLLGKWSSAWIVDSRGFTSVAEVWNGTWKEKVHLLWSWDSGEKESPAMGLFHIEKTPAGFSRKTRIAKGRIQNLTAAIDPESGRIVVAFNQEEAPYLMTKLNDGAWSRPTPMRNVQIRGGHLKLEPPNAEGFPFSINDYDTISSWILVPDKQ